MSTVLGDVVRVVDCEHRTAPRADAAGAYGFSVGTSAVRGGRISLEAAKPVTQDTWRSWTRRAEPRPGDLIFSREAPMGEVAEVPSTVPVCLGQRTVLLQLRPDLIDQAYLKYKLMSPLVQRWITSNSAGSTVPHLNVADVRRIPIGGLPSLGEQRYIVDMLESQLSRLDAAAGTLRRLEHQVQLLEQSLIEEHVLRSAVMHGWTPLESWAASEVGAITDGPFGSNLASRHYQVQGPRVIRLQNIGDGVWRDSDAHISPDHFDSLRKHEAKPRDLVLASLGDGLPRAAIVPPGLGPAIVKADCIRVRLLPEVSPEWVLLVMKARRTKNWAASRLHGVGRQRLGMAGIRSIPTPATPPAEQTAAVERVAREMDGARRLLRASAGALNQQAGLRRSILQAAFSGKLSSAEPAQQLEEMAGV